MVLAAGSYSREQSSPLYTVNTAGKVVEVGCSAAGRAVMVKLGSAAGRAVRVCSFSCRWSSKSQLAVAKQQGVSSAVRGISQQRLGGVLQAEQ